MTVSKYINVLGSQMHYLEAGYGKPILFVAGNPAHSYLWRNVIPHIATRYRCVAVDLIGMGHSDKPHIEYSYDDQLKYFTAFVAALIYELDLEDPKLTLVLHGWGSVLGLDYASSSPQNIGSLVLLEPLLRAKLEENRDSARLWHTPEGAAMVLEQNWFVETALFSEIKRELTAAEKKAYRAPYPTPQSRIPILQLARSHSIDAARPGVRRIIVRYMRWLRDTRVPKLLLHHADHPTPGMLVNRSLVDELQAAIPNLRSVEIGDAGHYSPEDQPDSIGREIRNWLQEINRGDELQAPDPKQERAMQTSYPPPVLQEFIDRAVPLSLYLAPAAGGVDVLPSDAIVDRVLLDQPIHALDIDMAPLSPAGPRAKNRLRGPFGNLSGLLSVIPYNSRVLPGVQPESELFDPTVTQRLVINATLSFKDGSAIEIFGTGRTLPMRVGETPRVLVSANAKVMRGTGTFDRLPGFVTLAGELRLDRGLFGCVLVQLGDPHGQVKAADDWIASSNSSAVSTDYTYLHWQCTKGENHIREANYFSLSADGTPRTINSPIFLRQLAIRSTFEGGIRSHRILGPVVSRERGLGIPTERDMAGTTAQPIPFQGFAEDIFFLNGNPIGSLHINWLEGHVVRVQTDEFPGQDFRRFGYYGFIVRGSGCFEGATGLVHGAGGGALDPPLGLEDQVFDNYYMAQFNDPDRNYLVG